jgi:hypothetical protein
MTLERFYEPGDDSSRNSQSRGTNRLQQVRHRSNQYAEEARSAVNHTRDRGDLERQLDNLLNEDGQ